MAVILLSGGLDSALNLALASREKKARLALTVKYGQRAEMPELKAAESLCNYYGVQWKAVDMQWLGEVNPTGLTRNILKLPEPSFQDLDSTQSIQSMKAVWVANRNGVFLNLAAAYAEALGDEEVIVGFNREEASTFPDNSQDFIDSTNKALSFSTLNKVKVGSYTTEWDKTQIMKRALEIELPLQYVWSCYQSGPDRCWACESCKRSERALLSAGDMGREWLKKMGWKNAN